MLSRMKLTMRWLLAVSCCLVWGSQVWGTETNHNFAVWEAEISAYEHQDAVKPPSKDGIEFVGSSTIKFWTTLAQDFPDSPVYNRGFGGSEIVDSTHFASRIIFPYAPRKIFFRAGGNDLANGKSAAEVFANFKEFATLVHSNLPSTEIYYIAWNPTPSRWKQHESEKALNGMIAGFIHDQPYLKYIETYDLVLDSTGRPRPELFRPDQLHFNAAGYRLLVERVRPYVLATGTNVPAAAGAHQ
jgi:hypothetical protein